MPFEVSSRWTSSFNSSNPLVSDDGDADKGNSKQGTMRE